MPYSTLFWSIHTNSVCSLMSNNEIPILPESKKSKYYLGAPKLKENGSEYSLLEKIYNALLYYVLEYIHQLCMLSKVKYRNSNFMQMEKI